MRKLRILVTVMVAVLALTISVSAMGPLPIPTSPRVPAGYGGFVLGGGGDGGSGYVETSTLLITPYSGIASAPLDVQVLLRNAKFDLDNYTLDELVTDFALVWKKASGGAPVENASIAELFDVTVIGPRDGIFNGKSPLTFTANVPGLSASDKVLVIHKTNGAWVVENNVTVGDGKVTITVASLSCFAVIVDNGAAPATASTPIVVADDEPADTEAPIVAVDPAPAEAPVDVVVVAEPVEAPVDEVPAPAPVAADAPTSPQTGVNGVNVAIAAAVVMAAFGSACIVKANRRHDA